MRASAIGSDVLPPGTAERHDIDRAPDLNVYDAAFAGRQIEVFEDDLKQSRQVSFAG